MKICQVLNSVLLPVLTEEKGRSSALCPRSKRVLGLQARTHYDYKENKENYWKTQLTLSDDDKQVKPVFFFAGTSRTACVRIL